jgi:SHS family lactate transporter-like MFS transporter
MSIAQAPPVSTLAPAPPDTLLPGTSVSAPEPWLGSFLAGLSGWTLDAFDFFLVVLALTAIGKDFGQSVPKMLAASWATLALRPVGAFLFGLVSDRFGRRRPLVINLCFFAVVELATAFTHSYKQFIIVRALFGIVMGGQWGLGAALAMEKVPVRLRGILSGLFQQGYAIGFLLAAGAYFTIFNRYGWRPLFFVGSIPALLAALFVAFRVTESESWKHNRSESFGKLGHTLLSHWKLFLYFTIFMMAMHMSSHGTQDMYPTFLEKDWGIVGKQKAALTAIASIGAIVGGLSIGWISDRIGRRLAMRLAMLGALVAIPLWAFSHTLPMLVCGAVLMQFCVQGAWGVVPAHVAEVSPDSVRGTLPSIGNQVGVVLSGSVAYIQALIAHSGKSYAAAMAMTAATVFCLAGLLTFAGHEHKSKQFGVREGK